MANDYLRPPAPRVPPEPDEPWRVAPSPRRRRRRLLVPALSVAAVAVGAGVLYAASPPGAPAARRPAGSPDAWLNRDRPPPGPVLARPGSPAAPDARRPGRDPRPTSGGGGAGPSPAVPSPAVPSPAVRPRGPAPKAGAGDGAGDGRARERPRANRPRTRRPPRADGTPAWMKDECRRRYPSDETRRDACVKVLRHRLGG
ncbi:hypothetical protein [Actinomadura sp. LOL_011]|uniref:hypothetical protein n=1 Tax=Actinomadura sp. LOL_011 TaxID=3345410 RepID=UPI003A80DB50